MARSSSADGHAIETKDFAAFGDLRARRRALQARIRKRKLLILSLLLVLVSGLSLALVSRNESVKRETQAIARAPEPSPGGCTEQRYDETGRRIRTVEMRCAAGDFDAEGRPIYRGTIRRIEQVGKAFR